jgi:hypothetical protein
MRAKSSSTARSVFKSRVVLTALNVFDTIPPLSATAIQPVPSHSHKTEIFFSVNDLISFYLLIALLQENLTSA